MIDMEYDRVYVCELEPGDTTPFGEVVADVERITDERTRIEYTNGAVAWYRHGTSTILIRR